MSKRASIDDAWGKATNLGPKINTPANDTPGQLLANQNLFLFKSGGTDGSESLPGEGGADLFSVRVIPEPSTTLISTFGVMLIAGFFHNQRRKKA